MIIIKGRSGKSIALANYINNNIGKDKQVVMFDSVNVPNLQYQIEREYDHFTINHSFDELIQDLSNENAQEIIKDADVIIFECNISIEELKILDESKYNQQIIITVQTDDECKVCDTKNKG